MRYVKARQVTEFPKKRGRTDGKKASRYDKVLDGKIWQFTPTGTLKLAQINILSLARRRGLRLKTRTVGKMLVVQVVGKVGGR